MRECGRWGVEFLRILESYGRVLHPAVFSWEERLLLLGRDCPTFYRRAHGIRSIHATTSTSSWTRIPFNILHDLVRTEFAIFSALQVLVDVRSMALVASADIDLLLQGLAIPRLYRPAVYHDGRPVVPCECHDDAGHVLVAAGYRNAGVVVLGACYRLDAIGDDFAGLEREAHSWNLLTTPRR